MTIRQLHYFVAVVETRSFTQAARRFYVAQTAVSQQIAALEKEMGVLLFSRTRRRVEPTDAGLAFYHEIRPLVVQLEGAIQQTRAAAQRSRQQFRLGLAPEFPARLLPPVFRQMAAEFPALSINLQCEQISALAGPLKNGDLDAVLAPGDENPDSRLIVTVPLAEDALPPFMLLVRPDHPAASAGCAALDTLAGQCLILSREATTARDFSALEPYVNALAAACPLAHSADAVEGIAALVSAGLGIALIPAADYGRVPGTLRLVPCEPCPPARPLALYHHRNSSRPELIRFAELCSAAACGSAAPQPDTDDCNSDGTVL